MTNTLSRTVNKKLAFYLILVLGIFTFVCFTYVSKSLNEKTVKGLLNHTEERAKYESKVFSNAERNMKLLEEHFFRIRSKRKQNGFDHNAAFDKMVPMKPGGKRGTHLAFGEGSINQKSDAIISTDYAASPLIKEVFVDVQYVTECQGDNEIGSLSRSFIEMTGRINDYSNNLKIKLRSLPASWQMQSEEDWYHEV